MTADTSQLAPGDKQALAKLLEAAGVIDDIFLQQLWSGNAALRARLTKDISPLGKARLHYFDLTKARGRIWTITPRSFPAFRPKKLPGANFYPEDMTKDEFETWVKKLPKPQQEQATRILHRDPARRRTRL